MAYTMKQARVGISATQQDIADRMGIHVQTYSRLEKNPENVTVGQAVLFAKIVNLPISDIFFGNNSN